MKNRYKWFTYTGIVIGILILFVIGSWTYNLFLTGGGEVPPGPETTAVEGPVREDGSVDYVEVLNQQESEGVTSENNAFVPIANVVGHKIWKGKRLQKRAQERLGISSFREDLSFQSFRKYAMERVEEDDSGIWDETVTGEDGDEISRWQRERRILERGREGTPENGFPLYRQYLSRIQDSLDHIAKGSRRSAFYFPVVSTEDGAGSLLKGSSNQYVPMRIPGAFIARGRLAIRKGDYRRGIAGFLTLHRLANHLKDDPRLIPQLFGMSSVSTVTFPADLLESENISVDILQSLKRELLNENRPFQLKKVIDQGERYSILSMIQYALRTSEGEKSSAGNTLPLQQKITRALLNEERLLRKINDEYDRAVQLLSIDDPRKRRRKLREPSKKYEGEQHYSFARKLGLILGHSRTYTDAAFDLLMQVGFPDLSGLQETVDANKLETSIQALAISVEIYRLNNGTYPESLEEALLEQMETVPEDTFAPEGTPITYERKEERILIYSIGPDGVDDDGKHGKDDTGRYSDRVEPPISPGSGRVSYDRIFRS